MSKVEIMQLLNNGDIDEVIDGTRGYTMSISIILEDREGSIDVKQGSLPPAIRSRDFMERFLEYLKYPCFRELQVDVDNKIISMQVYAKGSWVNPIEIPTRKSKCDIRKI